MTEAIVKGRISECVSVRVVYDAWCGERVSGGSWRTGRTEGRRPLYGAQ